jgi:small subunit ribosomal protein S20
MPLIKSAKKRVRISLRKSSVNTLQKAGAKTAVRNAARAIAEKGADTLEVLRQAASRLDRAAAQGAIAKNKAARLKSRLAAQAKAAAGK